MAVTVIAFGQIAEITGKQLTAVAKDTDELKALLQEQYPALESRKYTIAVNKKIVSEVLLLNDNDEVALMPPYSGG